MATSWSNHRPRSSIRYRSLHVSSSVNDSFKKFTVPAPVDLIIHTFLAVDRTAGRRFAVVARFGKRWEFGDNHEVCKTFVCQYTPPRLCCSWGPAEAKRCMPSPIRLHCMASVMVMWLTLSSHSSDTIFRRPNRYFFICTLHSDSLDTLLYAWFYHSEPRVLRMETKKSWMGTFP